jgi:hypothetical protein
MQTPGTATVITGLEIDIRFEELAEKIQMSATKPAILNAAETVFNNTGKIWQPAVVYDWFDYEAGEKKGTGTLIPQYPGTGAVDINLGHSGRFLSPAFSTLVAVYTAGAELDAAAAQANKSNDFLAAHFLDLLGLLVLEKTEKYVKRLAQEEAVSAGWGVSPFLSPGSVHGWDLEEQAKLAGCLPIKNIRVGISEHGVFSPFKTISCLIGIGPGYKTIEVGSTCRVCSKREDCRMQRNHTTGN